MQVLLLKISAAQKHANRERETKEKDGRTHTQTDKQTDRQTNRQTNRQTETQTHTHRNTDSKQNR